MALAEGVRESTLERFKEGTSARTGRRWKTSIRAATTEGGKTLIDSAQLRNSIQVTADASGFAVGTNVKARSDTPIWRPGAHHPGPEGEEPPLPGGRPVGHARSRSTVNIPARPFLGLSDEDMQEIEGDDRGVHPGGGLI